MTSNKNKKQLTSVGIVGCGWLGTPLAQHLKKQGVAVLATRSNTDNVKQLTNQGINAAVLSLPAQQTALNNHPVFKQQCLVIAITPQFRQGRVDYADKVAQLVTAAKNNNKVETIILLSSSAVYNGLSGLVDESMVLDLTADKVSVLNQAEQTVLNFTSDQVVKASNPDMLYVNGHSGLGRNKGFVLRLTGLVGPNRHPGKFLSHGRMLQNPQAQVNLIHQQDAVSLILSLLASDIHGGIFNGVSATQVTKKQYYQAAANALNLPPPSFEEKDSLSKKDSKIVSGKKTQEALHYAFVYDDSLAWLEQGH